MGRQGYVPLRCLGDIPLKLRWVFHLRRRVDALMGRRCCVLLRRCHHVPIRCCGDVPLRPLGDVPPRRCWVFHLRRTCDLTGTYRETSLRRRYDVQLPGGYQLLVLNFLFRSNQFWSEERDYIFSSSINFLFALKLNLETVMRNMASILQLYYWFAIG